MKKLEPACGFVLPADYSLHITVNSPVKTNPRHDANENYLEQLFIAIYNENMNWQDYIERDPEVMLGKPVFKGTRLTVEFILERLGQGAAVEELLNNYVGLQPEHIRAAQAYAASVLRHDELVYKT
jgi:uncharacterized protein (DUF433 family)